MSEAIIVAIITGGISLLGTIITIVSSSRKTEQAMATKIAVTETKLDALTNEVRLHNDFAQRVPRVEERIDSLSERMKILENNVK